MHGFRILPLHAEDEETDLKVANRKIDAMPEETFICALGHAVVGHNALKGKLLITTLETISHSTSKHTVAAAAGLRQRCSDERVTRRGKQGCAYK